MLKKALINPEAVANFNQSFKKFTSRVKQRNFTRPGGAEFRKASLDCQSQLSTRESTIKHPKHQLTHEKSANNLSAPYKMH